MMRNIVTSGAKAPILNSSESARLKPHPFKATDTSSTDFGLRTLELVS